MIIPFLTASATARGSADFAITITFGFPYFFALSRSLVISDFVTCPSFISPIIVVPSASTTRKSALLSFLTLVIGPITRVCVVPKNSSSPSIFIWAFMCSRSSLIYDSNVIPRDCISRSILLLPVGGCFPARSHSLRSG